jgi:hypothetical protein
MFRPLRRGIVSDATRAAIRAAYVTAGYLGDRAKG